MSKINSRDKGARFEREVAAWFRDTLLDPDARRGQQFAGGTDSPDVVLPNMPWLHVEAKRVEKLNIYNAMLQAKQDAGSGKIPTVFMRKNGEEMLVVLPAREIGGFAIKLAERFHEMIEDAAE
jgi:hypothetical protein